MTGHLTRGQLEQLVADDPRAPVPPVLRVHVSGCDRCSVRKLALDRARANYVATHPAADFARAVVARAATPTPIAKQRRPAQRVFAAAAAAFALVAGFLLWQRPAQPPAAIRAKGGVSLQVIAKHDGIQSQLLDGAVLAPGDQLAFAYALDRPRHLLLLGIDGSGQITRYYPEGAAHA
jgi:hypothetical protein